MGAVVSGSVSAIGSPDDGAPQDGVACMCRDVRPGNCSPRLLAANAWPGQQEVWPGPSEVGPGLAVGVGKRTGVR